MFGKQKKAPRNTEQEAREAPIIPLVEAMIHGSASRAIEAQEAAGQRDIVVSDTLPTKMDEKDKEVLTEAGVEFLGPVTDDPLFQYVDLPPGWKKVATGHSMWSDLVDAKGRKRAAIFYKAAFYDRDAHLHTKRRYSVQVDYALLDKGQAQAMAMDGESVIHTTEPIEAIPDKRYDAHDEAARWAASWLDKNYPNWRDASAYWD